LPHSNKQPQLGVDGIVCTHAPQATSQYRHLAPTELPPRSWRDRGSPQLQRHRPIGKRELRPGQQLLAVDPGWDGTDAQVLAEAMPAKVKV
jgi:hypothetical protein